MKAGCRTASAHPTPESIVAEYVLTAEELGEYVARVFECEREVCTSGSGPAVDWLSFQAFLAVFVIKGALLSCEREIE